MRGTSIFKNRFAAHIGVSKAVTNTIPKILSEYLPSLKIVLGFGVFLGWIYAPALFRAYAHHDDFLSIPWAWNSGQCGDHPLWGLLKYGSGRPLGAQIVCLTNRFNIDFNAFAATRRLSFLVIVLFAALFYKWLTRLGCDRVRSGLVSAGIFTLPWITTSVGYGNNFVILFSACLSFIGSLVLFRNLHLPLWRKQKSTWLGTAIICICFFIYQPPAMWPLVTALSYLIFCERDAVPVRIQVVVRAAFCQLVAIGAYYISAKSRYMNGWASQAPLGLWDKYVWYFREPLRDALSTWVFPGSDAVALFSLVLILLGAVAYGTAQLSERNPLHSLLLLGASWILLTLVPIPTMGVDLRDGSYRGMTTLIPFVFVGLVWSFFQIASFFNTRKQTVAVGVLACVIMIGANESRYQLSTNLVGRNQTEIKFLKASLFDLFAKGFKQVIFVQMPVEHMGFGRPSRQENELFDLLWPYKNDQFGLMNLVLEEMGLHPRDYRARDYEKDLGKNIYGFSINGFEFIYVPRISSGLLAASLHCPMVDFENKRVVYPHE